MKIKFGHKIKKTLEEQYSALGLVNMLGQSSNPDVPQQTEIPGSGSGAVNIDGANEIVQRAQSVVGKWVYVLGAKPSPDTPLGSTGVSSDCTGYVWWTWNIPNPTGTKRVRDSGPILEKPQPGCAFSYGAHGGATYGHAGIVAQVHPDGDFDTLDCGKSAGTVRYRQKAAGAWYSAAGGKENLIFSAPPGSKLIDNPNVSQGQNPSATPQKVNENKKIIIKFGKMLEEGKRSKDDRCVRIAKRKYDAWPSAYASGAVVKCRQGKIWKGVSEGTEELDEEWSEKYKRSIDCKHPKGFSQKAHCQGRKKNEEVELEERKLGKPSSETNLGDWFKRKGAPGKKGGWVDCNTCRDGKCKPCGRQEGEKRSKYPRCRPTPAQCKGYKRKGDNLQKEE